MATALPGGWAAVLMGKSLLRKRGVSPNNPCERMDPLPVTPHFYFINCTRQKNNAIASYILDRGLLGARGFGRGTSGSRSIRLHARAPALLDA